MKKVMISQPMADKTEEEIKTTRDRAIKKLNELGYEVVNTLFTDEWVAKEKSNDVVNVHLWFLAKSLQKMSECDAVYFCKGWGNTRGCEIEHDAAELYELELIYE